MEHIMNERLFYLALFIMVMIFMGEVCLVGMSFFMNNRKIKMLEQQMGEQGVKQEAMQTALQEMICGNSSTERCKGCNIQSEQERCKMQNIKKDQDAYAATTEEILQKEFDSSQDDIEIISEVLSNIF